MDLERCLKEYFGYTSFRPFQKEVIEHILHGKDCLVVMATGYGKSICYQIPPLVSRKTSVVISPLISLMQDQVMGLKSRGIKAEYLGSAQTDKLAESNAQKGVYDIVYMTPEKACSISWSSFAKQRVSLVAVDEAHCISEWGHDFRPEYKQLYVIRAQLPGVPVVALTATATHKVRDDIKTSLQLKTPYTAMTSFDRSNLFYGVKPLNRTNGFREELAQEVVKDLKNGGSTVIYCNTIKDVDEVTESLVKAGANAAAYHSKLGTKERNIVHRSFLKDELQVVVATVAFGMGIDKPDIRKVIHYGCPKSLESYYQESGRCGRDGLPSTCWLYYTRSDFMLGDFYTADAHTRERKQAVLDSFSAAQQYCQSTTCRRKVILKYFGETVNYENCGKCDNCVKSGGVQCRDMVQEVYLILAAVKICGGNWGMNMPIDVLRGSRIKKIVERGYDQVHVHGLGREKTATWWKALGDQLLSLGYLNERRPKAMENWAYRTVSVSPKGEEVLGTVLSGRSLVLPLTDEMLKEEQCEVPDIPLTSTSAPITQSLSDMEVKLYNSLLDLRTDLARKNSTAPYMICNERTLQKLALVRPSTIIRLRNVEGINQWLVQQYGADFVDRIKQACEEAGMQQDNPDNNPTPSSSGVAKKPDLTKITSAKSEAWRMWQEQGLTFAQIATLPERPKPIKEETVIEYISECIRAGCPINWERFFDEVGMTTAVIEQVTAAVEKAGSKEKLKPIKENLSESVTYTHIKVYLLALEHQVEMMTNIKREEHDDIEVFENSEHQPDDTIEQPPWASDTVASRKSSRRTAEEVEKPGGDFKRNRTSGKATEESLLQWLSCNESTLEEMVLQFSETERTTIATLVKKLEESFLIYKSKDIYRLI